MNRTHIKWIVVAIVVVIAILLVNIVATPRAVSPTPEAAVAGPPAAVVSQQNGQAVEFYEFVFVELQGRPEHGGYAPIQGSPLPGKQATLRVKLFGGVLSAT